jgi:hypothetical protein
MAKKETPAQANERFKMVLERTNNTIAESNDKINKLTRNVNLLIYASESVIRHKSDSMEKLQVAVNKVRNELDI